MPSKISYGFEIEIHHNLLLFICTEFNLVQGTRTTHYTLDWPILIGIHKELEKHGLILLLSEACRKGSVTLVRGKSFQTIADASNFLYDTSLAFFRSRGQLRRTDSAGKLLRSSTSDLEAEEQPMTLDPLTQENTLCDLSGDHSSHISFYNQNGKTALGSCVEIRTTPLSIRPDDQGLPKLVEQGIIEACRPFVMITPDQSLRPNFNISHGVWHELHILKPSELTTTLQDARIEAIGQIHIGGSQDAIFQAISSIPNMAQSPSWHEAQKWRHQIPTDKKCYIQSTGGMPTLVFASATWLGHWVGLQNALFGISTFYPREEIFLRAFPQPENPGAWSSTHDSLGCAIRWRHAKALWAMRGHIMTAEGMYRVLDAFCLLRYMSYVMLHNVPFLWKNVYLCFPKINAIQYLRNALQPLITFIQEVGDGRRREPLDFIDLCYETLAYDLPPPVAIPNAHARIQGEGARYGSFEIIRRYAVNIGTWVDPGIKNIIYFMAPLSTAELAQGAFLSAIIEFITDSQRGTSFLLPIAWRRLNYSPLRKNIWGRALWCEQVARMLLSLPYDQIDPAAGPGKDYPKFEWRNFAGNQNLWEGIPGATASNRGSAAAASTGGFTAAEATGGNRLQHIATLWTTAPGPAMVGPAAFNTMLQDLRVV